MDMNGGISNTAAEEVEITSSNPPVGKVRLRTVLARRRAWLAGIILFLVLLIVGIWIKSRHTPQPSGYAGIQLLPGVQRTVLPNGLVLLTRESHSSPIDSVSVVYRVGQRDEPPGQHEIAHILVHMLLKAACTQDPNGIKGLLAEYGAVENAGPFEDYTEYHETIPAGALPVILKAEADRMTSAQIDTPGLNLEKQVVHSELTSRWDQPLFRLREAVIHAALPRSPYGDSAIGHVDELRRLNASQVSQFYHEHYGPNTATVVVVGDIQRSSVVSLARSIFGPLRRCPAPARPRIFEPRQSAERSVTLVGPGSASYLSMFYHIPETGTRTHFAFQIIRQILTGGVLARLNVQVLDRGLAIAPKSFVSALADPYGFEIVSQAAKHYGLANLQRSIDSQIEQLRRKPVSAEELSRAKHQLEAEWLRSCDTVSGQSALLGDYATIGHPLALASTISAIEQTTPAEVQDAARTYLSRSNRTVGWYLPTGGTSSSRRHPGDASEPTDASAGDPAAAPAGQQLANATRVLAAARVALRHHPRVLRRVLPNGVTVIVCPRPDTPEVCVSVGVRAGTSSPDTPPGVAAFTQTLLHWRTSRRTGAALARILENQGSEVSYQIDQDLAHFNLRSLPAAMPACLDVISDELQHPRFSEASLRLLKVQANDVDLTAGAPALAYQQLMFNLYPDNSPFHWPMAGTAATRARLRSADLVRFHTLFYRPDRCVIAIVGPVTPGDAFSQVTRCFGAWARSATSPPASPSLASQAAPVQLYIAVPGATQSSVELGFRGRKWQKHSEAAELLNRLLGGAEMHGRLARRLRGDRGLVYGIYSSWYAGETAGPWLLRFQCRPQDVHECVETVKSEISALQHSAVSADELQIQKNLATGGQLFALQTNSGLASQLVAYEEYNGDLEPWQYPDDINRVTPAEVQDAARRLMHPESMVVSVAGPPVSPPSVNASER